jgi:protein-S-isoprenylcysteine O-methyltransferase Ste14
MTGLASRACSGLFRGYLAFEVLIFLPAWSLDYRQGWLCWGAYLASSVATTAYFLHDPALVERRIKSGPIAERRPSQKVIQGGTSVTLCATIVVSALDHRFGWSVVPWPVVLVGAAGIAIGFAVIFAVFRANSFAASTIRVEAGQTVVTTGPYAIVRHPMYAGGSILFIGTPLSLGSCWGLFPAAAAIAAMIWRLLDEERFLASNLADCDDYRRRLRWRLVAGMW